MSVVIDLMAEHQEVTYLVHGYVHEIESKNKLPYSVPSQIFLLILVFQFPMCPHGGLLVNKPNADLLLNDFDETMMVKPVNCRILPWKLSQFGYRCSQCWLDAPLLAASKSPNS